jgi:hypothetical protein
MPSKLKGSAVWSVLLLHATFTRTTRRGKVFSLTAPLFSCCWP